MVQSNYNDTIIEKLKDNINSIQLYALLLLIEKLCKITLIFKLLVNDNIRN